MNNKSYITIERLDPETRDVLNARTLPLDAPFAVFADAVDAIADALADVFGVEVRGAAVTVYNKGNAAATIDGATFTVRITNQQPR